MSGEESGPSSLVSQCQSMLMSCCALPSGHRSSSICLEDFLLFLPGCDCFESYESSCVWLVLKLLNPLRMLELRDDKVFGGTPHPGPVLEPWKLPLQPPQFWLDWLSLCGLHAHCCVSDSLARPWAVVAVSIQVHHCGAAILQLCVSSTYFFNLSGACLASTGNDISELPPLQSHHLLVTVQLFLDEVLASETVRKYMVILSWELSPELRPSVKSTTYVPCLSRPDIYILKAISFHNTSLEIMIKLITS